MEKWRGVLRKVPSSRYMFTIIIYYTKRHFLVDWRVGAHQGLVHNVKQKLINGLNYATIEYISKCKHFVGSNKRWRETKTSLYQINSPTRWLVNGYFIFYFGRKCMTGQGQMRHCLFIFQSSEGGKWLGIETPWEHQRF